MSFPTSSYSFSTHTFRTVRSLVIQPRWRSASHAMSVVFAVLAAMVLVLGLSIGLGCSPAQAVPLLLTKPPMTLKPATALKPAPALKSVALKPSSAKTLVPQAAPLLALTVVDDKGSPSRRAATRKGVGQPSAARAKPARQSDATTSYNATASYDFGPICVLEKTVVEHSFVLRNDGEAPVTIRQVEVTSGAISAALGEKAASRLPQTVAPGKTLRLRLTASIMNVPVPRFEASVILFAEGQGMPVATCKVLGRTVPGFAVFPARIDFGHIGLAGSALPQHLTVTIDPDLSAVGVSLRLMSSCPSVRVTPVPDAGKFLRNAVPRNAVPRAAGIEGAVPLGIVHRYLLTLAPTTPAGPLKGMIYIEFTKTRSTADLAVVPVPVSGSILSGPVTVGSLGAGSPTTLTRAETH